jgi:hypothetical protein
MVIWRAEPGVGPPAPPGTYRVRLTADGRTQEREFRIRIDPRLEGVTEEDLRAQFRLASAIRDATDAAHRAVIRIREVRAGLADRLRAVAGDGTAGPPSSGPADDTPWTTQAEAEAAVAAARTADPELADAVERFLAELRPIETALYQTRNRSHQDPLNFPIRLDNRLATLRRSVENGEARPTDGHHRVYRELAGELRGHLDSLDRELEEGLPRVNALLEERGLGAVEPRTEPGRIPGTEREATTG